MKRLSEYTVRHQHIRHTCDCHINKDNPLLHKQMPTGGLLSQLAMFMHAG